MNSLAQVKTQGQGRELGFESVSGVVTASVVQSAINNMVQNEVDAVLAKLGLRSQDIKEFVYLTLQDALTAGDIQFASLDASTPNTPTFQLNLRQTVTDRLFKPGGSVGQIPKKNTTSNYDWDWANDATSGSTPPPVTTATFYLAVVTTTTPTASDFTSGTSMTGSLPISFTILAVHSRVLPGRASGCQTRIR